MARPRFSKLTRVVAVVFGLAGVGALIAGLSAGNASDGFILACLAAGFLAVGAGVWMEYLWAWWAAIGASLFTVVMTPRLAFPPHLRAGLVRGAGSLGDVCDPGSSQQ